MKNHNVIVTGGAGFIGSNFVRMLIHRGYEVLNIDKLTYAGNLNSLTDIASHQQYQFLQLDLVDGQALEVAIKSFRPSAIVHLAAESHVDRSIDDPEVFIQANVHGTFNLLQATKRYLDSLSQQDKLDFRLLHVSTDEVYGSLGMGEEKFTETSSYRPNSPYSASKAAADHLVRAWHHTYKLPVMIANCCNNYGPYQFPEKLIPVVILKCLRNESIPVYGQGINVRDWIFVDDHCDALISILKRGRIGETYNIGANDELRNIDVVQYLCNTMDELAPRADGHQYSNLITFVKDRLGHDLRYAIDAAKLRNELNWKPKHNHLSGFRATVKWYLENQTWWQEIASRGKHPNRWGQKG